MSPKSGNAGLSLAELCQEVLMSQAQTLKRLAALFGEEALLELLEQGDEDDTVSSEGEDLGIDWKECFERPTSASRGRAPSEGNAYQSLEGVVQEAELPAVLEFHLWAFPPYRALIESPQGLDARVKQGPAALTLVDALVRAADQWIKKLPIAPALAPRAEQAAQVPWLRFRTEVLKRLGQRPLGVL
jgi:hypothetical protein